MKTLPFPKLAPEGAATSSSTSTGDQAAAAAAAAAAAQSQQQSTQQSTTGEGEKKTTGSALGSAGAETKTGTETKTGEGADKKTDANAQAAAPYEIKLPEGLQLDQGRLDGFKKIAQEAGISAEQASKLAEFQLKAEKQLADDALKAWERQDEQWAKELREDKEFGGAKFDASKAAAQKAVMRFGGRELAERLEALGLGNDPLMFKAFARAGLAIAEDDSSADSDPSKRAAADLTEEERLLLRYPSLKPKK